MPIRRSQKTGKKHSSDRVPLIRKQTGPLFEALNPRQSEIREAYLKSDALFLSGPPGSAKSFLAAALAAEDLVSNRCRKIYLTRPAVEAGESLGFLPGDKNAKLLPFLMPVFECFEDFGMDAEEMVHKGQIEILPLGFVRGRTFKNGVAILDEAQNCLYEPGRTNQLLLFLTRMGVKSKVIVTGDPSQSDVTGGGKYFEALIKAIESKPQPNVSVFRLTTADIVRHELTDHFSQCAKVAEKSLSVRHSSESF